MVTRSHFGCFAICFSSLQFLSLQLVASDLVDCPRGRRRRYLMMDEMMLEEWNDLIMLFVTQRYLGFPCTVSFCAMIWWVCRQNGESSCYGSARFLCYSRPILLAVTAQLSDTHSVSRRMQYVYQFEGTSSGIEDLESGGPSTLTEMSAQLSFTHPIS